MGAGPHWALRLGLLLPIMGGVGTFYFMVVLAIQRIHEQPDLPPALLAASVPFGVLGLLIAGFGIYFLSTSFTVYRLDGDRLIAQGPRGSHEVDLSAATAFHTGSLGSLIVEGAAGSRVRVELGMLPEAGKPLRQAIEAKLAAVRDRQMSGSRESGWRARTFYPWRFQAVLMGLMSLSFLGSGIGAVVDPRVAQGGPSSRVWFVAIMLACGLVSLGAAVLGLTSTLRVGADRIVSHTLVGDKAIPFDRIDSVTNGWTATRGGRLRTTTVRGNGRKIAFNETMPDYDLVRGYVEQHYRTSRGG